MFTAASGPDEVVVYLKPSDYTAFQRFYKESQKESGKVWPFLRRQLVWLGILIATVTFLILRDKTGKGKTDDDAEQYLKLVILIIGMALGVVLALVILIRTRRIVLGNIKKEMDDPRTSWQFGPVRISISPEGMSLRAEFSDEQLRWPAILKIGVTDTHAFFFTKESVAHVIPCRAFPDADAFDAFVERARAYREDYARTLAALPPQRPRTPAGPSDAITDRPT